jgi:formylglycine-generating enzyme required for sulfatase activity
MDQVSITGVAIGYPRYGAGPTRGGPAGTAKWFRAMPETNGGSWNNNRTNCRCAYRNDNHPDNFNNNIGFRVVFHDAQQRAGKP